MTLQTILVPKNFSLSSAMMWVLDHNYKINKIEYTENFYRFRQRRPRKLAKYYSIKLNNGVVLVMME